MRPCVFEYIYFSRPDSILNGKTAYEYRKRFGAELAKEDDLDADLVVPVPDSGNAAALGYAEEKKINFDLGLIRTEQVIELIKMKPDDLDLVLTGNHAKQEIIDLADLVTEMKEIKHPFKSGIKAKKGIDF